MFLISFIQRSAKTADGKFIAPLNVLFIGLILTCYSLQHHREDSEYLTVNPLLSPPGGLFLSSTFEGGHNREGGLI